MNDHLLIYFIVWLILSFLIGFIGLEREIGYLKTFLISFLLSPLLGLIFALTSKKIEDIYNEKYILDNQEKHQDAFKNLSKSINKESSIASIAEGLEKLKKLKDDNIISEEEFILLKNKAIQSYNEDDSRNSVILHENKKINKNLIKLNSLIKDQKYNLLPSSAKKKQITDHLNNIFTTKKIAIDLLDEYKEVFKINLVKDLEGLSNSFDGKKDYLSKLIELEIVSPEYPHNVIA